MEFRKKTIQSILGELPEISIIDFPQSFAGQHFDLFIQSVGFEERTKAMCTKLSQTSDFTVKESIILRYKSNIEENLTYEQQLKTYISSFSKSLQWIVIDNDVIEQISQKVNSIRLNLGKASILLDISTLSSKLILSLTKILIHKDIHLMVLYTEGRMYHPVEEEFERILLDSENPTLSQTSGIESVTVSPEFNGMSKDNQDLIICFPSFKAERTEAVIASIDELILKERTNERIFWILGEPNMVEPNKQNRTDFQKKINRIGDNEKVYVVSCLDYKKTIEILDHIYYETKNNYHINISNLGSKMQSFGIAIFASLRSEITVHYSEPKTYNPAHYSEGIKEYWAINLNSTKEFIKKLYSIDTISLEY